MAVTSNKDFKALVRLRMRSTGETYTAARAALESGAPSPSPRWREAEREQQQLINRWFVGARLRAIPARRKVRAAVLLEVLARFVPGRTYSEHEVSDLLESIHPDFAYLRRELISLGYLVRHDGRYWVCVFAPIRTDQQRRELPVWEQIWLPEFTVRVTEDRTVTW